MNGVLFSTPFKMDRQREPAQSSLRVAPAHRRVAAVAVASSSLSSSSSSAADPLESLSSALRNVEMDRTRALQFAQMYAQMKRQAARAPSASSSSSAAVGKAVKTSNQQLEGLNPLSAERHSPSGLASSPLISSNLATLRTSTGVHHPSNSYSANNLNGRRASANFLSPNAYPAGHIVLPNRPRPNSANSTPTATANARLAMGNNDNNDNQWTRHSICTSEIPSNASARNAKNEVKPLVSNNIKSVPPVIVKNKTSNSSNNNKKQQAEQRVVQWRVAIDPKTKRPYYYHPVTRQTTWKKPKELVEQEKREKAQFFSAMEQNILNKLQSNSSSLSNSPTQATNPAKCEEAATASASPCGSTPSNSGGVSPNQPAMPTNPEVVEQPTRLFRTLSSCDGSLSCDMRKGGKIYVSTFPSPIHEGKETLASPAPSPATSTCSSMQMMDSAPSSSSSSSSSSNAFMRNQALLATRIPVRRRSNSTSTIFVRMGTMNAPDQDLSIKCVATVLRSHLLDAMENPIENDTCFDLFQFRGGNQSIVEKAMPSLEDIATFMRFVYSRAQMESECIIMSLIYVERLLKATSGRLQLQPGNWRTILFCSMIMASKVWDDLSMCNADFVKIWPDLTLREINDLELLYLSSVEYNVRVSAVSYAKYYFHLRSICASMGQLAAFDESAPLNLDAARKMQVISEEYQERSKLSPCVRRRSVTITSPAEQRNGQLTGGANAKKTSPSASLEQIVRMQVSQAGGSMLGRNMGRSTP